MKFLSKALKFILILILLLVLLAILTALSWYEGWPLFTGAAALLGIAALCLAARGAQLLWRWRNKRAFVSKMMSEQQAAAPEEGGDSAVSVAWRHGMSCVLRSPSRFSRTLNASQPWFVVIEDEASESSPFDSFGRKVPDGASPLYWHFTESCVVLRLSCSGDGGSVWKTELEELLAARRRHAPLRGVVLSLRLADLLDRNDAELDMLGQRLRTRVQQIMLTANALYPVYILVEEIENMPGIGALLTQYLPDGSEGALGGWDGGPSIGALAAANAADRLEEFVLDGAAEGTPPHGDVLSALNGIRALAPKLDIITENLSRELAHQVNPEIAGVYFCASRPLGRNGRRTPPFVGSLLSRVLPAAPLPRPFSGIPVSAGGRIALMAGWLLLTLSVCGLLAANTIYQYRILAEDPHVAAGKSGGEGLMVLDPAQGPLAESYSRLYSEMNYILNLEKSHGAWYLPNMGEDMLGRALNGAKREYVRDVNRIILRPMIDRFRDILSMPATGKTRERDMELATELTWLTAALSDRLGDPAPSMDGAAGTYPLTGLNEAEWTPVTGQLIVNALRWIDDEEQLEALSMEIRSLLVQSFTRRGSNLMNDITAQLNSSRASESVRLSQFWTHIPIQSEADVSVDFCYTAAGRKAVRDTVEDIEEIAGGSEILGVYIDKFRNDYLLEYARAWENFAESFTAAGPSLLHENFENYPAYDEITKVTNLPHIKAYRCIMAETAPLRESKLRPAWVDRMDVVDAVVSLALANSEDKKRDKLWNAFTAVEKNPDLMGRLRTGVKGEAKVSDLVKAETAMRVFFENCATLLGAVSNPSSAFSLCSAKYGEEKGAEQPEGQPYDSAQQAFDEAFSIIGGEWSPAQEVLGGILDFIAAEATIETAQVLQRRWEDEVLNSPTVLFGRGGGEAIYGETGVVPVFVQKNLGTLLSHRGGVPVPSLWDGTPFPFDDEFLAALMQGAEAASQPLPPERKESYSVSVMSRPLIVNQGAQLRPSVMTLTLEGEDGPQQLVNQNFPQEAVFTYSPGKSGRVTLVISFPGFDLRREYAGFKEFVTEFRTGEKTFFQMDFPGAFEKMEAAGLKTIKVPLAVSNTAGIFTDPKAEAERKFPELPSKITRLVTR